MPKLVDTLPEVQRKSKYDFAEDFAKSVKAKKPLAFAKGTDFDCAAATFRSSLYKEAAKAGYQVAVRVVGDTVYAEVTAHVPQPSDG